MREKTPQTACATGSCFDYIAFYNSLNLASGKYNEVWVMGGAENMYEFAFTGENRLPIHGLNREAYPNLEYNMGQVLEGFGHRAEYAFYDKSGGLDYINYGYSGVIEPPPMKATFAALTGNMNYYDKFPSGLDLDDPRLDKQYPFPKETGIGNIHFPPNTRD